jgi:hypothetical protein
MNNQSIAIAALLRAFTADYDEAQAVWDRLKNDPEPYGWTTAWADIERALEAVRASE